MLRRILSGGGSEWHHLVQGDKADKTRTATDQGSHYVDEDIAMADSQSCTDTDQQAQAKRERPVRGDPQRGEESPAMLHHPSQTSLGQRGLVREHPQRATAGQHSPTDAKQQGPSQASEEVATVRIEDLETDDIVIAVMGPTGSGKSTLICAASGVNTQEVGHTLKSCTNEVIAIRFCDQESGRHVVLVDTPGFDDTFKSDLDILNMISNWLNKSYKKQKLLSGILYLHRITDNRMAGTPLKNLRVFRKLCGKDALDKVYLVTTMWDEVDPKVGQKRLEELKEDYWKAMVIQGAQVVLCRNDDDSPKRIIQGILDQEAIRKALLLQEEMSVGKKLKETEAGQELYSQLEKLVERQVALLRSIGKERSMATEPSVLAELQTEYNELRMQIDNRLRQMQELKLPRLKSLFRFFSRK